VSASSADFIEHRLWSLGYHHVGGVDEAGRGPLAGPLVAGCVVLSPSFPLQNVPDSKRVSSARRRALFEVICREAVAIGLSIVSERWIDLVGIQRANELALYEAAWRAIAAGRFEYLVVDWMHLPWSFTPVLSLPKAEERSLAVACAALVAKFVRDSIMEEWYDPLFPEYGFSKHKGYGTALHFERIRAFGLAPCHRRSFCGQFGEAKKGRAG
jgi:ribonuclease HII